MLKHDSGSLFGPFPDTSQLPLQTESDFNSQHFRPSIPHPAENSEQSRSGRPGQKGARGLSRTGPHLRGGLRGGGGGAGRGGGGGRKAGAPRSEARLRPSAE